MKNKFIRNQSGLPHNGYRSFVNRLLKPDEVKINAIANGIARPGKIAAVAFENFPAPAVIYLNTRKLIVAVIDGQGWHGKGIVQAVVVGGKNIGW